MDCGVRFGRDTIGSPGNEKTLARTTRVSLIRELCRRDNHLGENGCFAVSFFAMISAIFGSPFIARSIESFVAS